jgi:hypothetical protein
MTSWWNNLKVGVLAWVLAGISVVLFIVALHPSLPFFVAPGNYEICYVTVHATLDGKPLPNLKVKAYNFIVPWKSPPEPTPDPDTMGTPVREEITNQNGEATLVLSPGNYTIKLETSPTTFDLRIIEVKHQYHDVYFTYYSPQQEKTTPNIILLCIASAIMAVAVTIWVVRHKFK